MNQNAIDRGATSSTPEDLFADLFAQVFGPENTLMLAPQYPVKDIYDRNRFVDYALRTRNERIAFEIDGATWHVPEAIPVLKYEDDLLKQNSLIHQGWRVFRWTDRQIVQEPEQVKDQLVHFLERLPGLLAFDDFLPRQTGEILELRAHQDEALQAIQRIRDEGKTIALLDHATGAGKTVTAIADAKRFGGRTLWLTHKRPLVSQTRKEFKRLWPEVSTGRYLGGVHEADHFNLVGVIRSVVDNLDEFSPNEFAYLVIDEAHHAAATTYRRVLEYFRPQFIIGLTATPERTDSQNLLDLFRDCAHRLTLRQAVERGELVPIRCVRVETNINLSRVRYNQVQYNRKDIEETILVPERDRLIVRTYLEHVPGRRAVAFAVNVRHGESLAEEFRRSGVRAASVSGRMSNREREQHLDDFAEGRLQVLCACDILNEGWDCPSLEVLLMARPTLSKIIYLQQLGRGTRKAPGKECLLVFDFVDNANRYNQSLSLHRVLGENRYRRGGLVLGPQHLLEAEEEALARGDQPTTVLEIGLWARDYQEIDVFNWQEVVSDMLSASDMEIELAAAEGRIRSAVERGLIVPDHTLTLGERTYYYFIRDRAEEIRQALGLPRVDDASIRKLFLEFVAKMDMSSSYKPVLLLAILDKVDDDGRASINDVALAFHQFYLSRLERGLPPERPSTRMHQAVHLARDDVRAIMLGTPFRKFEQRKYLSYDRRDVAFLRFQPALWRQLTAEDRATVRSRCEEAITQYYERI